MTREGGKAGDTAARFLSQKLSQHEKRVVEARTNIQTLRIIERKEGLPITRRLMVKKEDTVVAAHLSETYPANLVMQLVELKGGTKVISRDERDGSQEADILTPPDLASKAASIRKGREIQVEMAPIQSDTYEWKMPYRSSLKRSPRPGDEEVTRKIIREDGAKEIYSMDFGKQRTEITTPSGRELWIVTNQDGLTCVEELHLNDNGTSTRTVQHLLKDTADVIIEPTNPEAPITITIHFTETNPYEGSEKTTIRGTRPFDAETFLIYAAIIGRSTSCSLITTSCMPQEEICLLWSQPINSSFAE